MNKELEEMKKKYEDYICLYENKANSPYGWHIVNFEGKYPEMYKFIHKDHHSILDAVLADSSVKVYFNDGVGDCVLNCFDFIGTYDEKNKYEIEAKRPIEMNEKEFETHCDEIFGEESKPDYEKLANDAIEKYEKLVLKYDNLVDRYISVKYPEIHQEIKSLKIKDV